MTLILVPLKKMLLFSNKPLNLTREKQRPFKVSYLTKSSYRATVLLFLRIGRPCVGDLAHPRKNKLVLISACAC
jgi:hypothetical protein